MAKDFLTDAQVESEIARLTASPLVKLAKREQSIKYARRQYMYQLRSLEKRGKQLSDGGITLENIDSAMAADGCGEDW